MPKQLQALQQMHNFPEIFSHFYYQLLLRNASRIVITIIAAIIIWILVRIAIVGVARGVVQHAVRRRKSTEAAAHRAQTLASVMRKSIGTVYWVAIILTILSQVGINIGALVASAGVFGLAISFGAQALVRNCIAGFFIIFENQISVGDMASINGVAGIVEAINFRTTILRSGDGAIHVFPNGDISQLVNSSRDWSAYLFSVRAAYKEDIGRVIETIQRVGAEMRGDAELGKSMIADIEVWGVNQFEDSGVLISGRLKTLPGSGAAIRRAFLGRVKRAFDVEGIEIPLPQRRLSFEDIPASDRQHNDSATAPE